MLVRVVFLLSVLFLFLSRGARANHHVHHQRAARATSKPYDPDACGSSWISYVSNDIANMSAWRSRDVELHEWRVSHAVTIMNIISTTLITSVETVWKSVSSQCDHMPRITSAREITHVLTSTLPVLQPSTVYDSALPMLDLPNPWEEPVPKFPVCDIRPDDCQPQWDRFITAFTNTTITFEQVAPDNPYRDESWGANCMGICSATWDWTIDTWLYYRPYPSRRGFFSGCRQAVESCAKVVSSNDFRGCEIHAERFVLIFFASEEVGPTDLCTNATQHATIPLLEARNSSVVRTAILESIVFGSKERIFGFNTQIGLNQMDPKDATETLSAATMHNPNKWTFTSPSVYLAYDTIAADGPCAHPGKELTHGILTLHASDIKTTLSQPPWQCVNHPSPHRGKNCSPTYFGPTTTELDFADLLGPPASRAYFNALPSKPNPDDSNYKEQLRYPSVCFSSICEDRFFPRILMPEIITDLEPAFTSCDGVGWGVWDPPIAFLPTSSIPLPTITPKPSQDYDGQTRVPLPGPKHFDPDTSPTMTSGQHQTQVFNTRSWKGDDKSQPQVQGSFETDSSNPHLRHEPTPTTTVNIGGTPLTIAMVAGSQQRIELAIGTATLKAGGDPTVIHGQLLSYGTNGILFQGTKTVGIFSRKPLATNGLLKFPGNATSLQGTPTSGVPGVSGASREFYEQPASKGRKKSAAGQLVPPFAWMAIPRAVLILVSISLLSCATRVHATHHAHHQRATTSNLKTASYDPDGCRSSWISYVDNDLSTISAWRSRDIQLHDWRREHVVTVLSTDSTWWETPVETVWKPISTQCDGIPRITSFSEVTYYPTSHTQYDRKTIYDSPLPAPYLPNPWDKEVPPFPTCEIRPDDCQRQWTEFSLAFANYTLTSKQLRFDHWPEDEMYGCMNIICEPDVPWSLDAWLKFRTYETYRGFFSSCPQPAKKCLEPYVFKTLSENEIWSMPAGVYGAPDMPAGCGIAAERFVLIFFAPEDDPGRDLCSNGTHHNISHIASHSQTNKRTATLESIVFGAKQRMFGFNIPIFQQGNSKLTIMSIDASTMYNTDKWTFTSPSVYLAYDTIAATGACSHPGRQLSNGILTLQSSDIQTPLRTPERMCVDVSPAISSFWSCPPTYTGQTIRDLNFADLLGPPPSSAYFQAVPNEGNDQYLFPPECRTSICEDHFFPKILMPSMITDLEPAFKACSGIGYPVWDPPVIFSTTSEVRAASITANSAHNRPDQKNTPMPGSAVIPLNAIPTMTGNIGSQTQISDAGAFDGKVDAHSRPTSNPDDQSSPSIVTREPASIVINVSGMPSTIPLGLDGSQQGGALVLDTLTLKLGDTATLPDGQLLSYGAQGTLYRGTKTAASVKWDPLITNLNKLTSIRSNPTLSIPHESREFYEQQSSERRKKSEAVRMTDILPAVLTMLGFTMGAWSMFCFG